jgi:hypothetical protein
MIHEHLSVIMTFVFSRKQFEDLIQNKFRGEWKYLRKALFSVSQERAERSCIELGTYMRLLDDQEDMSGYLRQVGGHNMGRVIKEGQPDEPLYLRDMTNKMMHAIQLEWDFSDTDKPKLVCIPKDPARWGRAEIDIISLAALCGQLMS